MTDAFYFNKEYVDKCLREISNTKEVNLDNWDIELWRKNNPVDYLKMLAIIVGYSSNPIIKNETFKIIYKITRLYIPNQLVKYYSLTDDLYLNELKFDTLKNKQVYLSDSKAFNDPFDNKAFFYRPDTMIEFNELRHCNGKLIDDFSSYIIGSSFSSAGINAMTMWGNYANSHQGYCVSYNTEEGGPNTDIRSFAFPIQYIRQRVDISDLMYQQTKIALDEMKRQISLGRKIISLDDLSLIFMIALLTNIKFIEWEKELEFRVSVASNSGKPYVKAIPSAIYVGLNCKPENEEKLLHLGNEQNIPVYKMQFDEIGSSYTLSHYQLNKF